MSTNGKSEKIKNKTHFKHKVLVVDDEKSVGKSLGRLLSLENIKHVYCNSAKDALKEIQSARTPFSLIISDQRMPGGTGTDFLEQAKTIAPDTICFLITAHSDLKTVIESVNKGAVYKYIIKPWDNEALLDNIKTALMKYQLVYENKMLLEKAVEQNKKLYRISCQLMGSTDHLKTEFEALDKDIETLETEIQNNIDPNLQQQNRITREIETEMAGRGQLNRKALDKAYSDCVQKLYLDIEDLANRNGFLMINQ